MADKSKSKFPVMDLSDPQRETAKAVYDRLKSERDQYTDRAEKNAAMTIPALFPKESDNESTSYLTPNQSIGARGVNNLASKLMLALLPPNSTFFRLTPTDAITAQLAEQPEQLQEIEKALEKLERRVVRYIETEQIRVTVKEALNQLLVAGNALLFLPPLEGGAKLYRLSNYVLQRDALGKVIQLVTVDTLAFATLPDEIQTLVASDGATHEPTESVNVYTHVYLDTDQYLSYQEVNGELIDGSEQSFPVNKSPWIALRMVKVDGESYGRSYVEEYLGDLESLDVHTEALRNLAAITGHILYLVNPTGITQVRRLTKAKSGAFVPGRVEDVQALQTNKSNDLQVSLQYVQSLEQRLGYVFMLQSAVQRDAERVTAEEIRYLAGELEDTLGGTYSILSQELQLPLVRRIMAQLESMGEIPTLPEETVEPTITTGLEAIGRGHDLNKLLTLKDIIASTPGSESCLRTNTFIAMCATALGIDTEGLLKTDEEIMQEQQQAMMMQMAQQATSPLAQGFVNANMEQPQQQ